MFVRIFPHAVEIDGVPVDAAGSGEESGCWADVWSETKREYVECGKDAGVLGLCAQHARQIATLERPAHSGKETCRAGMFTDDD